MGLLVTCSSLFPKAHKLGLIKVPFATKDSTQYYRTKEIFLSNKELSLLRGDNREVWKYIRHFKVFFCRTIKLISSKLGTWVTCFLSFQNFCNAPPTLGDYAPLPSTCHVEPPSSPCVRRQNNAYLHPEVHNIKQKG